MLALGIDVSRSVCKGAVMPSPLRTGPSLSEVGKLGELQGRQQQLDAISRLAGRPVDMSTTAECEAMWYQIASLAVRLALELGEV